MAEKRKRKAVKRITIVQKIKNDSPTFIDSFKNYYHVSLNKKKIKKSNR